MAIPLQMEISPKQLVAATQERAWLDSSEVRI